MLRQAWNASRSPSGDTIVEQTITTTTTTTTSSSSRRRVPSAPEARLRRLFGPSAPAQRAATAPTMCSDSAIVPGDAGPLAMPKSPCYCHTDQQQHDQHMQQHIEFTCKLNFEDVNYNYNYIENEYFLPARIIPRFSSLPRTISMLAQQSRSSSSSDDECHSLADSLEDLSKSNRFDEKPVRGDATLALAEHNEQRAPVPKPEKFFVGLSEEVENLGLQLPAFLKDKLDKRKQELEQKKPRQLEPLRSRTPKSGKLLNKKFRPFESIPEENSETNNRIKIARSRAMARNYQPRFQMAHSQRALQGIVQESKDLSILQADGREAVQTVVPLPVPAKNRPADKDMAPGWGNFYVIKGSDDKGDSPKAKSRKKWTKIETSSSEERVMTTVKIQNPKSQQRQVRQQRATTSVTRSTVTSLPRLLDDRASARSEGCRPAPNLQRHPPVPAIKPKSAHTPEGSSLPTLPEKQKTVDTKTFTRPKASKSAKTSPQQSPAKVLARPTSLALKSDIEPGTIVAEAGPSEPGTWSVTLTGLYPQPEMELRLLFPPEGQDDKDKDGNDSKGNSPKKSEKRIQSPMDDTNSVDYILVFKNNKQAANRPGSAGSTKSRSRPTSAGSSPSKTKSLVPVTKALVPATTEIVPGTPDEMLMWPEVQSLLQEQMTRHVKKQVTTVTTSETKHVTTTTEGAIMVQRLRGGEGMTYSSNAQPVMAAKSTSLALQATQRRKRASS